MKRSCFTAGAQYARAPGFAGFAQKVGGLHKKFESF
jgi:hypothetical protein